MRESLLYNFILYMKSKQSVFFRFAERIYETLLTFSLYSVYFATITSWVKSHYCWKSLTRRIIDEYSFERRGALKAHEEKERGTRLDVVVASDEAVDEITILLSTVP